MKTWSQKCILGQFLLVTCSTITVQIATALAGMHVQIPSQQVIFKLQEVA